MKYIDPDGKRGRPARGGRDLTRNYNLMRYGRGNPRYAAAYPNGIRPQSERTIRKFSISRSNIQRQPLPNSPIENIETAGGNRIQISRGNREAKRLTAGIELMDHAMQVTTEFKNMYTENGSQTDISFEIGFSDPEEQASFEKAQSDYDKNFSEKVSEMQKEGKHNTMEIISQITSDMGLSPKNQILVDYLLGRLQMKLEKQEKQNIPEFR